MKWKQMGRTAIIKYTNRKSILLRVFKKAELNLQNPVKKHARLIPGFSNQNPVVYFTKKNR